MRATVSDVGKEEGTAVLVINVQHGEIRDPDEIQELFQFVSNTSSMEFPNQRLRDMLEVALKNTGLPG